MLLWGITSIEHETINVQAFRSIQVSKIATPVQTDVTFVLGTHRLNNNIIKSMISAINLAVLADEASIPEQRSHSKLEIQNQYSAGQIKVVALC